MLYLILVFVAISSSHFIRYVVSHNGHSQIVIPKCCPENEAIIQNFTEFSVKCLKTNEIIVSFPNITIYDKDVHDKPISKSFSDIFQLSTEKRPDENILYSFARSDVAADAYLSEDGFLWLDYVNSYLRWLQVNSTYYCLDYELVEIENSTLPPKLSDKIHFWCGYFGEEPQQTNGFFSTALLVSVVFLVAVLIVYILLPNLRNLGGKVLMAYVFSLLMAFLFLAVIQIFQHAYDDCLKLTTTIYFFFLASFCWMTVMSYDIWWTFRGYAKARPIHRRGENFKFIMYCIYGWGLPLAMSIAFVVISITPLKHMPWFVKPQVPEMGCFIEGGQKLVYLYAPMLILIICNWMFFVMTAFNIWRLNRGTAVLDSPAAGTPQAHRSQKNRFIIYLKLSIVMGINWLLEVISSLTPEFKFWYISDVYNLLIGLAIFLIFVCKKKIYRDLKARFIKNQKPQRSLTKSQTSCTTLSNSCQDTPLQVISHPNGTSKVRR